MSGGQSPTQPLPQSQGGGGGDPTGEAPALDPSAPAPATQPDRGGVVPDEPTTPAAPPAVDACELFTPEGLASHSRPRAGRATTGPVGGGVSSPNVTSARNTDQAPAPERNTDLPEWVVGDEEHAWTLLPPGTERVSIRPATETEPAWDRTTAEPDDGHPPHPGTSDGEETDPGPEGGTSRNTEGPLDQLARIRRAVRVTRDAAAAQRQVRVADLMASIDRSLAELEAALRVPGPTLGPPPDPDPYGREFKEAVRQVLREDQHETTRRAIMRELDRFSAPWFPPPPPRRPWYDDTQERRAREALANHPPVDSAQEPPPNVQPGLVGSDHSGITPHYVTGDTNLDDGTCDRAPRGWWCSRRPNHDGPCAARPRWWNVRRWFTRKATAA